jgi:hypothetical protein
MQDLLRTILLLFSIALVSKILNGCNSFLTPSTIPKVPYKSTTETTETDHLMLTPAADNHSSPGKSVRLFARKTLTLEQIESTTTKDALLVSTTHTQSTLLNSDVDVSRAHSIIPGSMTALMIPLIANAEDGTRLINLNSFKTGLTVENFQPVCSVSDNVYRVLQQTVAATVGPEKFVEYGPLIAGGLLRVRLELCVVESFISEAVVPFIRDNGVSWILPIHETVETFLAGAIFALATTFILIGSTKLVTVLVTYTDFVFGLPSRLFGGFIFDRAQGKPVTLDIGIGPFQSRILGPPKEKEIPALKVQDISPLAWIVLLLSGTVNYFGKFLQVCS